MRRPLLVLIVCAAFAFLLALPGCTDRVPELEGANASVTDDKESGASAVPVTLEEDVVAGWGESLDLSGLRVVVGEPRDAEGAEVPSSGTRMVTTSIRIVNVADTARRYRDSAFVLQCDDGMIYTPVVGRGAESLRTGELGAGEEAAGVISFRVPNRSQPTRVIFTPNDAGGDFVTWRRS